MRLHRIFCPELPANQSLFELPEKQANYVGAVLRLRTDDVMHVFNGKGDEYFTRIVSVNRRHVLVALGRRIINTKESPLIVELGQVLSRGDRMDFAIQKSVELGVSLISPLLSERCEVKLDPHRMTKRRHHWQQIVYSASEQCGRSLTPQVRQPQALTDWLVSAEGDVKFVFHPQQTSHVNEGLHFGNQPEPDKVILLVGPEGGFSEKEVNLARQHGFQTMTLGPRILRTETAPIVALSFVQQRWGDL